MRVVVDDRPGRVVGDALDDLGPSAATAGQRDEGVARCMKRLALDAGFPARTCPELGTALFGVVHEPLDASALSTGDDEVRGTGFAAVHELEALAAPPRKLPCELGVEGSRETELFIVEHRATVSALKQRCLDAKSIEEVLDVLEKEIDVVWILRDEDDKLTELKYRSKRPPTAYEEAQIEIWDGK